MPVVGGWVSDTFLGRFKTILGSAVIYCVGTSLLAAVTYDYGPRYDVSKSMKEWILSLSLALISIGTGGIKSNVSLLGADQVEHEGPEMVVRFFNWFYWFIQAGSFIAFTAVVYIQQEVSFFYGYLITPVAMLTATFLLLIGRNDYILYPPQGSALSDTFKITWDGLKRVRGTPRMHHFLDRTKQSKGGRFPDAQVDGVKSVLRLIPVFLSFIFYWTIYGQVM